MEAEEEVIVEAFRENGMTVTEPTDEEMADFQEAMKDTKQKLIDMYGEEACSAFHITAE